MIIALLAIVGVITVFVGKVVGPRILDWISPSFNNATSKIDNAIMGNASEWESKVIAIVECKPEELKRRTDEIFFRYATPTTCSIQSDESLSPSARSFFERYSQLSFDGHTLVLDVSALRPVTYKDRRYCVIGHSEDDEYVYAIDLQSNRAIVRLEMDQAGTVFSVEKDAPSFEHFVILQCELYNQNSAHQP